MEKVRKRIRTKELLALLIVVLLFFLLRYAFLEVVTKASETRENEMLELNMSTIMDVVADVNTKRETAIVTISENVNAGIRMMVNFLKEFAGENGYDGPRTFSDGVVAELEGEHVRFPEGYRGLEKQVTREIIEESLKSGAVMTCKVTADEELRRSLKRAESEEYVTDADSDSYFLSFGEIAQDIIYVDILSEREYRAYLQRCTQIVNEALESSDSSFGGITLILRESSGERTLLRQYGTDTAYETLASQNMIEQMIRDEQPVVSMDGEDYNCAYLRIEPSRSDEEPLVSVQMIPRNSLRKENAPRVLLLELVMVIIMTSFTVYMTAVQRAMAEQELSKETRNHYSPKRMRKRMMKAGTLCVVITFAFVLLVESVGLMYSELRNGRAILNLFSRQLERNNEEESRQIREEEEEWIVYYGEKLALLLSEYPALNTREKLRETREIIGVETITLFDSRGRQTLCSGDYTGFRLDDEDYPALYDFRRLLYGVPSIIHEAAKDPITDLERQQIGVTMPLQEHDTMHGALIMTLLPTRTAKTGDTDSTGMLSSASGTICFAADSSDGVIVYSSKPGMTRKLISECGLPEDSLRDSIVDFVKISDSDYLMISSREGKSVCYYAAGTETVFGRMLQVGAVITLIFAAALALHMAFLLHGYNEETFREWEKLRGEERERINQRYVRMKDKYSTEESGQKQTFLSRLCFLIGWDRRTAGGKAAIVLHFGLIILILCILAILHKRLLPNESYGTMFSFFMGGRWMRGFNLFSLCGILLLISIAYLINVVCNLLVKLTDNVFSDNGETVIRLLYSCVRYITVIAVLYFGLEYLGFSTGTIIASLGILSLAISLGAQDLIKDILAGLAIVFDGSFHIGDVVEIEGTEGVVREIGVRATKLTVEGNNTLYINNHEIGSILNKSRELSEFKLDLRVPADESLIRIEEILKRELPKIGERNSKIVEGPFLYGVTGLSGLTYKANTRIIEISIWGKLDEQDREEIGVYLKREISLLFEREGIALL